MALLRLTRNGVATAGWFVLASNLLGIAVGVSHGAVTEGELSREILSNGDLDHVPLMRRERRPTAELQEAGAGFVQKFFGMLGSSKETNATAANETTVPPDSFLADSWKSCDAVCIQQNTTCDAVAQALLVTEAAVGAAMRAAGFNCTSFGTECQPGGRCTTLGSPYIHQSTLDRTAKTGVCQYGLPASPCSQRPMERSSIRLCQCKGIPTTTTTSTTSLQISFDMKVSTTTPPTARTWRVGCPGLGFGTAMLQIGRFRIGLVNGTQLSMAHEGGFTGTVWNSDGSVVPGPRTDSGAFRRSLSALIPSTLAFGDRFVELGPWRLGTVDDDFVVAFSGRTTAQIIRANGTVTSGPLTTAPIFDRQVGQASGIAFGDRFIQIGKYRLGAADDNHFSISHESGTTAQIFRSDGNVFLGPRSDFSTWTRQSSDCEFLNLGVAFRRLPTTWFVAGDFNETDRSWTNRGTRGGIVRDIVKNGDLARLRANGKGARTNLTFVSGNTSTQLVFGSVITSSNFTVCALSRYTGGAKGRILNGGGNWLLGHWNARSGVVHTQRWVTNTTDRYGDNWVAICARNGNQTSDVLCNGEGIGNGAQIEMPAQGEVTINSRGTTSCCGDEVSDFGLAELMVWDGDALREGMAYLQYVLSNGRAQDDEQRFFMSRSLWQTRRAQSAELRKLQAEADVAAQTKRLADARALQDNATINASSAAKDAAELRAQLEDGNAKTAAAEAVKAREAGSVARWMRVERFEQSMSANTQERISNAMRAMGLAGRQSVDAAFRIGRMNRTLARLASRLIRDFQMRAISMNLTNFTSSFNVSGSVFNSSLPDIEVDLNVTIEQLTNARREVRKQVEEQERTAMEAQNKTLAAAAVAKEALEATAQREADAQAAALRNLSRTIASAEVNAENLKQKVIALQPSTTPMPRALQALKDTTTNRVTMNDAMSSSATTPPRKSSAGAAVGIVFGILILMAVVSLVVYKLRRPPSEQQQPLTEAEAGTGEQNPTVAAAEEKSDEELAT